MRTPLVFKKVLGFVLLIAGLMMLYPQEAHATCDPTECDNPSEFLGWSKDGKYWTISSRQFCVDGGGPALLVYEGNHLVQILHTEACYLGGVGSQISRIQVNAPKGWSVEKSGYWGVERIDVTNNKHLKKYNLQPVQATWRQAYLDKGYALGSVEKKTFTKRNLSDLGQLVPRRFAEAVRELFSTDDEHSAVADVTCSIRPLQAKDSTNTIVNFITNCGQDWPQGIVDIQILGGYIHPESGDILVKTLLHEERAGRSATFDFIKNLNSVPKN